MTYHRATLSVMRNLFQLRQETRPADMKGYGAEEEFAEVLYPFVPYQFRLLQDVLVQVRERKERLFLASISPRRRTLHALRVSGGGAEHAGLRRARVRLRSIAFTANVYTRFGMALSAA